MLSAVLAAALSPAYSAPVIGGVDHYRPPPPSTFRGDEAGVPENLLPKKERVGRRMRRHLHSQPATRDYDDDDDYVYDYLMMIPDTFDQENGD